MPADWREKVRQADGFQKMDDEYEKRTSSGGIVSVLIMVCVVAMLGGEIRDYLKYRHIHSFSVDNNGKGQESLQVNVDMTVAMPCGFIRADVLDASGSSLNVHSSLATQSVSLTEAFTLKDSAKRNSYFQDMHVHDVIAEAMRGRKKGRGYKNGAAAIDSNSSPNDMACRIEGSVMVEKVAGMFHVTAHGHGHGGAHIPHDRMNFTHHIHEFSFGPFYPSLVNPLDETRHVAPDHFAGFRYFVSVVPTVYIDPSAKVLSTNQYAVNEYYKGKTSKDNNSRQLDHNKPPGIFFTYDFEPLQVTVREQRQGFLSFVIRQCAAVSGLFVTAGIIHGIYVYLSHHLY